MKKTPLILFALVLAGCSNTTQLNQEIRTLNLPDNWQFSDNTTLITENWLQDFNLPIINQLVEEALSNNQSIRQLAFDVYILKQQLYQSNAALLPSLDLSLNTGRSKNADASSTLQLQGSYEVDIWGKLSAAQKQANLNYLAKQAEYQQNKQTLVANVVSGWFDLVTASHLYALFEQRVKNAQQNLDIIESGYQQGLNSALDVYLSRNEFNSESSNLAEQKASQIQSIRRLERLLGRYPDAKLLLTAQSLTLPLLKTEIPFGMPSSVVRKKPELLASWYRVLAQDAALAFAHKQRFPSIKLTAAISDSKSELSDLLSGSSLGWSLLGNLTAPLFRAGDLKANEEIARLKLKQQEQAYLDDLYNAFASIENAVTSEKSLKQRYQTTLAAQQNAQAAETLSFEQYQKGLVSYTTVLDAQGRAFDAQSALLRIKNQLLANRVELHLALGGDFSETKMNQISHTNQEDTLTDE